MKKAVVVCAVCSLLLGGALLVARSRTGHPAPDPSPAPAAPSAVAPAWQAIGPDGGWIRALARNPKNASELYASGISTPCHVFKSSNAGVSWKSVSLVQDRLDDLIVHPSNPDILYGLAYTTLYRSKDGGRTFASLSDFDYKSVRLEGNISISPRKPETIYIAGSYRYSETPRKYCLAVYRSKDGGLTWTVHKLDPVSDYASVPRVAASPARAGVVYASGSYRSGGQTCQRVFKSADGGDTWTNVTGSINQQPLDLLLHPGDHNKAYVAVSDGVYRSSDGGKTWSGQASPNYFYPVVLAIDSQNPQVLYAGSSSLVHKSTDGGVRWTASKLDAGLVGYPTRIVAAGHTVHFASRAGIFRSADGANTWKPGHAGMKASTIPAFALVPASPKTIIAEITDYACFKSANDGASWVKLGYFAGCGQVMKIVSHPTSANTVYLLKGG